MGIKPMKISRSSLKQIILEELTKADVKKIAKDESEKAAEKALKDFLKNDLEKEIAKALKDKATKNEIADISKKVIKKLYRELSFNYPYIIDRVKL